MRTKKREIKATMPQELRETLERRAHAEGMSLMSYLSSLSIVALDNERIIRAMSPYFRRSYIRKNQAWMGRVIAPSIDALLPEGTATSRVSVKFAPDDYMQIGEIAYALGCSLSQALAIVISEAVLQGIDIQPQAGKEDAS